MAERRLPPILALLTGVVLLALIPHSSGHGAGAAPPGGAAPSAQPVLGTADRSTVLMGAATAGAPGEAWAYRVLQLDVSPPLVASGQARFAAVPAGSTTPPGQLVFERATDADPDWAIQETPLDGEGHPYRGMEPNRLSARVTPHGGGVLLGQDDSLASGKQVVVLVRDPGSRFRAIPAPSPGVLLGAGEGSEATAETLAEKEGAGAVADTAVENGPHTEAYFAALGRDRELAVARWDGERWSREPVDPPAGYSGSFQIVALAGSSPPNMWLLAKAGTGSGLGVLLFRRKEVKAGEFAWQQVPLGAPLFEASETLAKGIASLGPLTGAAQPLTVTEKGVWIDGNMQSLGGGSNGFDFTLYYDISQEEVTGSWCDARDGAGEDLCEHPFGARFGRFAGYRSFAFDGPGFGTRIVTNPLLPGGEDTTNLGSYLRLQGTTFERMPGAGANNASGGAFYSPDDGWLEGPVQITNEQQPARLVSWPVSARAPFTAVAPAPGSTPGDPNARALAVGADGVVARYAPGYGWEREFLLTGSGAVSAPTLRAVAWPDPNRAFAVGNLGAMWIWRSETNLWERDPATPLNGFQGNLDGIAFAPGNPGLGYAVGQDGVLLAYGKSWTQQEPPSGFSEANFTSVAFAGSQALVAAEHDLLVNDGGGWRVDPEVHALLHSLPSVPTLNVVAGLPNGGAVAAGHDVVLERDGASAPWHFSEQPIVDETAVAAAPYLEGSKVRALISVVPYFSYPEPFVLPPVDPNTPPPLIPPNPLPGDGYVLRETPEGWEDEERAAYAGDTSDKPIKADPIAAFDIGPSGMGWAVGGWSGEADAANRGSGASGGSGQQVRENVQTAGIYSFSASGDPQAPPGEDASAVPLQPGVATFAVGGHAECAQPCAALSGEAIAPDRNLTAALAQVAVLAAQPNGPRMLLYTGGRETPGAGTESVAEAERYAQLLASGGSLPVYPAVSAGDSEGGAAAAFVSSFASFASPFGTGSAPAGVTPVEMPGEAAPSADARTHYAFDSAGAAGTVRVIAIDNSRGSLAASDPYQNPAEAQGPWLARVLADAKARGVPTVVVGSRELNPNLPPALNVASDASEEAQIMVQGGASAYLYERPEESRASRIPSGATITIPEFGSGALGYRSSISGSFKPGQPDALFGTTGYLLFSVDASKRDPVSNVAPVSARLVPLVQSVSLDPVDGTLLRRSAPALFTGLGRRPLSGDRWGPISASDGSPNPPGADPYSEFPPALCRQSDCASAIELEYTFTSSDPEIANFVEQDPNSTNLRKPLQDASGRVITDPHSGILCAFNAGTTTVTVSAGGLSYSTQVTVLGGSVEQPCGTVPLSSSHFKTQAQEAAPAPSSPPPSPAPAPAPIAPPPPPPAVPVKAPGVKPAPKVALPIAIVPLAKLPSLGPLPAVPPPPAASFGRPIPPGGATVRVFEEKREEEAAPEQSQAFARAPLYLDRPRSFTRPTVVAATRSRALSVAGVGDGPASANVNKASSSVPLYLLGLALFMAAGGASTRLRPDRRRRAALASLSLANDQIGRRPRRRR